MESDVSSETHEVTSSSAGSDVTSSSSSEEEDLTDQPVRVYDARFKIPAQSNIGQLMSAKNTADLTRN